MFSLSLHHSYFFSLSTIFFLKNLLFLSFFLLGFCTCFIDSVLGFLASRPFCKKMTVVEDHRMDDLRDQFPIGMRVLAVDDDSTCLMVLETLLRRCQYHGDLLLLLLFVFWILNFWLHWLLYGNSILRSFSWPRHCYWNNEGFCFVNLNLSNWGCWFDFSFERSLHRI